MHPELLGGEYTHLDFIRRPLRQDLGRRVLYRDHYMSGWAYKTLTPDDLKYPLVCGEGKRVSCVNLYIILDKMLKVISVKMFSSAFRSWK